MSVTDVLVIMQEMQEQDMAQTRELIAQAPGHTVVNPLEVRVNIRCEPIRWALEDPHWCSSGSEVCGE
jgi:hypothetical protein